MRPLLPIALLALGLAACGKDAGTAPAPAAEGSAPAASAAEAVAAANAADASAEPALPPLPTGDFRVVAIELDRQVDAEGRAVKPVQVFAPGDTIHAAVIGVGSSDGLTLSARWVGPDSSEIAKAGQLLTPSSPTVTTFSIARPQPWPVGAYQLEVAINDRVVETRNFEVR